jgi:hypothetical protein
MTVRVRPAPRCAKLVGKGSRKEPSPVVPAACPHDDASRGGPFLTDAGGAPVVSIVSDDPDQVEDDLGSGALACPSCGARLRRWWYARSRPLRDLEGEKVLRPRRARCTSPSCGKTHVLLPDATLLRRRDHVEVIGAAILGRALGSTRGAIASSLDRHEDTVRGWLRAFRRQAEAIRAHFTRLAYALDPLLDPIEPTGRPFNDALAALGAAARAGALRLGRSDPWRLASRLSCGMLLSNTNIPWRSAG